MLETEKQKTKWKNQNKPIKNVFLRWSSKNEKMKKWIFSKNCLTLFVSGREKNAHFRAHYLFWQKFWGGGQNNENQQTLKKIVVSTETAQNQKWHLFCWKTCFFWDGWSAFFTNCVLEKLCSSESTSFILLSAKHSSCSRKDACWKQKSYEK